MARVEGRMRGMGGIVSRAALGVGVAVAGIGVASLKAAGDFESSLNVYKAVSGATGRQMKAVSRLSKQLGADLSLPATSAKDAADAMVELTKGGLSVKDTMRAARGVLQLSAAAQIDNARAAQIVARALNAFRLSGNEAAKVADVLANAANASTGEIEDFALGLQMSSAVANQFGLSMEDTTAGLMALANAGIVGSDAGTSLKTMLLRLNPVTDKAAGLIDKLNVSAFDSQGNFIGIREVISKYSKALRGMTKEQRLATLQQIFGQDAIRAANILLSEGARAFDKNRAAATKQGAAADLAAAKMKGFKGALEGFKSQLETLAISLGEPLLRTATDVVSKFSALVGLIDKVATAPTLKLRVEMAKNAVSEFLFGGANTRERVVDSDLIVKVRTVKTEGFVSKLVDALKGGGELALALGHMLTDALARVDWNLVARKMASGFGTAAGVGIKSALDPAFWARHWREVLDAGFLILTTFTVLRVARWGMQLARGLLALGPRLARALGAAAAAAAKGFIEGLLPALARFMSRIPGALKSLPAKFNEALRDMGTKVGQGIRLIGEQVVAAAKKVGADIVAGIAAGILGAVDMVRSAVEWLLSKIPGWARKLMGISSPSRVMAEQVGRPLAEGIAKGFRDGLGSVTERMSAELKGLNDRLAAIQNRRASEDRQRAVREAQLALAEARKKNEGVLEAERNLARAREDILVAGMERSASRLEGILQRRMDRLRDKTSRFVDSIRSKFDKLTGGGFVTPSEGRIGQIRSRREQEDLQTAVREAQRRLNDALAGGDARDIEDAQRALARAQEDIELASLEKRADMERRAADERLSDMRSAFDRRLSLLQEKLAAENATWKRSQRALSLLFREFSREYREMGLEAGLSWMGGAQAGAQAARQQIVVPLYMDGRIVAEAVTDHQTQMARQGGPLFSRALVTV